MISSSSSRASSTPATSLNVTSGFSLLTSLAFDLPKFIIFPPLIWEMRNQKTMKMMTKGMSVPSSDISQLCCGTSSV